MSNEARLEAWLPFQAELDEGTAILEKIHKKCAQQSPRKCGKTKDKSAERKNGNGKVHTF